MLAGPDRVGGLAQRLAVDGRRSGAAIRRSHRLGRMVRGGTHLFEEAGTLERVAPLASSWFTAHLTSLRYTA